jgi:hypothetical protein
MAVDPSGTTTPKSAALKLDSSASYTVCTKFGDATMS